MEKNVILTHRYIARFIIKADTPLFVGSGEKSLLKDALVQKDVNGLPMIQGTSLAGVLRHSVENTEPHSNTLWGNIFGYQSPKGKDGLGSRLKISSALMLMSECKISEGIVEVKKEIIDRYDNLPKRQHVRLDHKGVAIENGLFDNEVVFKGTKFVFEIELAGNKDDKPSWDELLKVLQSPSFRIGSGTRNGYGNLSITASKIKEYDLNNKAHFDTYISLNPSLTDIADLVEFNPNNLNVNYELNLVLEDTFFIFGETDSSGITDNKPLEEEVVEYKNDTIEFVKHTVIPASSIKGALAHRTAYHYNKLKKRYIDQLYPNMPMDIITELYTGSGNKAVNELFGLGAGTEWSKDTKGKQSSLKSEEFEEYGYARRGHVIIDDLYFNGEEVKNEKIFNHVAIDRFTGGAMNGALFSEKVSQKMDGKINLKIYLDKNFDSDSNELKAFENAIKDVCLGYLPLGGMTTKGHGMFTGTYTKNGEPQKLEWHESK